MRIGNVTLDVPLMLAPMAGVADASFRVICRRMGAAYTVSEMVSAKALCFEQASRGSAPIKTAMLANVTEGEAPMAVQLFGRDPAYMARAAALIESGEYRGSSRVCAPAAIDINMGCPVQKVVSNGEGSALMREPALAAEIVREVKRAVSLPVTVKIRAGFNAAERNAPELAKRLEDAGADLICVHGRTRQQFYAPSSDNGIIAATKRAVRIPVVGNGDIENGADALRMLEETECDALMIGRGTLGNPWIFEEVRAALEGRAFIPPTPAERLQIALEHATDMVARKGVRIGIPEARKHMAWYCKGMRGATAARDALMHAENVEGIKSIFDELLAQAR